MYQHPNLFFRSFSDAKNSIKMWNSKSPDYLSKVSRLFIYSSALNFVVLQDVTNYGNFTFLAMFNRLGAQTLNKLKHW